MLNVVSSHSKGVVYLVWLVASTALGQLCFMMSDFIYERVKMGIIRDVNMVFKWANLQYLVDQDEPDIKNGLSLMTNNLKQTETNRITAQLDMVYQGLAFVGPLAFALYNSWQMTVIFVVAIVAPAVVQIFTGKIIAKKPKVRTRTSANYTQNTSDSLNDTRSAKLYNVRNNAVMRATRSAQNMENALRNMNLARVWALELVCSAVELFCFIIPYTVGGIMMIQGSLSVDTLFMAADLTMNFITPVVTLFNEFSQVKPTVPMWKKARKAPNYETIENSEKPEKFKGLDVRNLAYQTKSNKYTIFTDVDLQVKPGEKILLMAPSGWGKATSLRLMLGLEHPARGKILINGENVTRGWMKAHNYLSYVNQKPFIFDDTLRFNITSGRKVSDEKLKKVIHLAGLSEPVKRGGLDHRVGEAGNELSGGQIQRIEIARAFLFGRPILLADETTSALDPNLSLAIYETLLKNPHVAVIEVAHKVSPGGKAMSNKIIRLNLCEGRED